MSDRHRGKRTYPSGSAKRQASIDKQQKEKEVLSKTRRMSDFFSSQSESQSSPLHVVDSNSSISEQILENNVLNDASTSTKEEHEKEKVII